MISDELLTSFIQVMNWYVGALVGSLGLLFNAINIVVFTKLGFSDTTNISLLSLAVADSGVLLTTVGYSVMHSPFVMDTTVKEFRDVLNFSVLGSSHILFSRIAGLLTAFITAERFLCVAWPFQVRSLITPTRTTVVVVSIYAFMTCSSIPIFVANQIGVSYNPELNATVYGLVTLPNSGDLESATLTIHMIAQMTSFVVVAGCTLGLIRSLVRASRWRTATSSSSSSLRLASVTGADVSSRDKQLVKITVLISVVFIACLLPTVVGNLVMIFVKDYSIKGSFRNVFVFTFIVFYFLDAVNSTVTIFIYFRLSSRYRAQFVALFRYQAHGKQNYV